ncbi:hypothetical protein SRB5_52990 [Streptomyces sp. RB5]|uniref:Uncharacterized protein n=1 Tax=Streptomyces smaragdinus TaxID=2585196 RepID=A0A7K0CNY2_9ACTN|nr:hypothetical protein [Streptomyces smaragdinus]
MRGGKLARVVRALSNDRILVQDLGERGRFTGRRHTTSAKWVTTVPRPDGSAHRDGHALRRPENHGLPAFAPIPGENRAVRPEA